MFDPLTLSEKTEAIVCKEKSRKYYRFRFSRFYGGIATADCVGCCLRCIFCWAWKEVTQPESHGKFYTPEKVAKKLRKIAIGENVKKVRVSGNEPTICKNHLIDVISKLPDFLFILETNGILIGGDEKFAEELSSFENLHVRVSLKGTNKEEFSVLTGAKPEGFELQIRALENLLKHKVSFHPSCMVSFSTDENIELLRKRLREIHPDLEYFEKEVLILYPTVERRLKERGLKYRKALKVK